MLDILPKLAVVVSLPHVGGGHVESLLEDLDSKEKGGIVHFSSG